MVELIVPQLRAVPRGETGRVFTLEADHVGIETFDDLVGQIAWSHHWMELQGRLVRHSAPYRFVWPSVFDLMARLAGLRLRSRWADWGAFTFHLRQQQPGGSLRRAAKTSEADDNLAPMQSRPSPSIGLVRRTWQHDAGRASPNGAAEPAARMK